MAGSAGQNSHRLSPAASPLPPLLEEMRALPGSFAFPQAAELAERRIRSQGGAATDCLRYSVNPDLSFPPGDIASVSVAEREGDAALVRMTLNFMGLHGASSPLPAYFTEYVAQHADAPDALRDFFDIFNHRLAGLLQSAWIKYRYYAQYQSGAADRLSSRFFGFIGAGRQEVREAKDLCWPRLMAYMGLIAFNSNSTGSLESILRHYFGHEAIVVQPCVARWVAIPADQQSALGEDNCSLDDDFVIGESMPDQTGKFRIRIFDLTWERFNAFLPGEKNFADLRTLVRFVLNACLDFDVELCLRPEEIRPWRLAEDNERLLGWSVWCGEGGDGVVVLETGREDG
jgi:type VI secretion system protein ImpH